jgi:O-antigen/teichoic acid export membrane protein
MKKDVFWNSLGTAAWSFLSLILLIVVTRVNGINESGLFSFAFAFGIIMFTVGCYGGRTYQVSDHHNRFTTNDYIAVRLLTSSAIIPIALLFVFMNGYELQKSALILLLASHRIFDAIADVLYGVLQKERRLYTAGISLFYKSLISFILFTTIDLLTRNLLLSALTLPVISLLFVVFYDLPKARKVGHFDISLKAQDTRDILKSTFLTFAITVMGLVFANLARYFIDIYSPSLQGYFGIIIMPLSLIILLFSFVSTPAILHLSEKYNNKEFFALNKTIRRIISLTLIATVLLCTLMYWVGAPLLKLLFGIDFTEYVIDIIFVVLIGFLLSATSLFTNITIIARRLRVTAAVYVFTIVLLALLCMILVGPYKIRGAIVAYIISSFIQAVVMLIYYLYLTRSQRLSRKS